MNASKTKTMIVSRSTTMSHPGHVHIHKNTGQKIPQMSELTGSNHRCRVQFKCVPTVVGQRFAGNGPNGLSYYYYYYCYYILTPINYWRNCTEGLLLPCYIESGIPKWPLRSIFAWFLKYLLKDLVSWGSPGECSRTDHFWRDAFGVLSCPFWSTVLQGGARLPIHTFNYWTVQSVVPGS